MATFLSSNNVSMCVNAEELCHFRSQLREVKRSGLMSKGILRSAFGCPSRSTAAVFTSSSSSDKTTCCRFCNCARINMTKTQSRQTLRCTRMVRNVAEIYISPQRTCEYRHVESVLCTDCRPCHRQCMEDPNLVSAFSSGGGADTSVATCHHSSVDSCPIVREPSWVTA